MQRHILKILPEYFDAVCSGKKSFEIRKNDRNYQVGDELILCEYVPDREGFTGREVEKEVVYITDYAQKENYIVMAID
ncbi:ASCH/PUA domain-containing protein [Bacillus subtilis]|uniref:ASCH/PUA domain-containing protein n=1 Tax=Bacillus subtilis TaxID=1423 RepID=UPI0023EDBF07|nr:ASCH/PUA domain-containing protein [Bacillus subtilis]MDF4197332.1 DUF3850 domain-containing protein [Bacillus subtilis]MDF4219297.1 DUF3850 domain-containing protein [Bacillus subtilis]